jgi:hypothetical protein
MTMRRASMRETVWNSCQGLNVFPAKMKGDKPDEISGKIFQVIHCEHSALDARL